jgi:hypothetical protein
MRAQDQAWIFSLPIADAERLRNILAFPSQLSALDPCVGDGVAFAKLLEHPATDERQEMRYGSYKMRQRQCASL